MAVSEAEIHAARLRGLRGWEEAARVCGAGAGCGACREHIDRLLRHESGGCPEPRLAEANESAA
jgi:bacterioferritin-associated ferredoxin